MYHFLSGFTSKLAGTERGVTSPEATFSTCFGSPFLPLHATVYAEMLGKKIDEHDAQVFLVNTGWTGGAYGVGKRMELKYTRAMVRAALAGKLNDVETEENSIFGLNMPISIEGVPTEILNPRNAWADKAEYDQKSKRTSRSIPRKLQKIRHRHRRHHLKRRTNCIIIKIKYMRRF